MSVTVNHRLDEVDPDALTLGRLHIVVVGPGSGEAIVVILPDGCVGVVDGCRQPKNDPVHRLLDALVKSGRMKRLSFAALTHPHDDHYRGFPSILDRFDPEHVWWAGDEEGKYFQVAMEHRKEVEGASNVGLPRKGSLLEEVVAAIENRWQRVPSVRLQALSDRKRLLDYGEGDARVRIDGLLPTSAEKRRMLKDLFERVRAGKKVLRDDPNEISGALLIRWGGASVLLAGDCHTGSEDSHCGLAGMYSQVGKIGVIKVPHHGSETSWYPKLWGRMSPAIGIITPFHGNTESQPPKVPELVEMLKTGTQLFVTRPKEHFTRSAEIKVESVGVAPVRVVARQAGYDNAFSKPRPKPLEETAGMIHVVLNAAGEVEEVNLHGPAREITLV